MSTGFDSLENIFSSRVVGTPKRRHFLNTAASHLPSPAEGQEGWLFSFAVCFWATAASLGIWLTLLNLNKSPGAKSWVNEKVDTLRLNRLCLFSHRWVFFPSKIREEVFQHFLDWCGTWETFWMQMKWTKPIGFQSKWNLGSQMSDSCKDCAISKSNHCYPGNY